MEEVDQIIFNSLVNIGCEFAEGLESLKQLTTENVVEASVKCLKIINPEIKMSHLLPPGMSARFRVGSAIAQACQSVGYRDNVGYQTFLYSSEVDIRKIFMFLIEKLPRKDGSADDEVVTASILKRRIAKVLQSEYASVWLPPYCSQQNARHRFKTRKLYIPFPYKQDKSAETASYIHQQVPDRFELASSVLELNTSSLAARHNALAKKESDISKKVSKISFQWKQPALISNDVTMLSSFDEVIQSLSGLSCRTKQSRFAKAKKLQFTNTDSFLRKEVVSAIKPTIPTKPSNIKELVENKKSNFNGEVLEKGEGVQENLVEQQKQVETEEEKLKRQETEMEALLNQTEEAQIRHKDEINNLKSAIEQMKIEVDDIEGSMEEKNEQLELKKKTVYLLPNADESMEKLKNLVEKSSQRLAQLTEMWEEKKAPLVDEIKRLNEKLTTSNFDAETKLEEIKDLRKRMKETSEETKKKEQMIKQLTSELESMTRDISRQSYTKRILEIVASIHKQKDGIAKVIGDMREGQKQMNQLKGRIDRTFQAVDEAMFRDTKKDENIRKAYKYLVALHDNCSNLIETVEETGAILRDIRELEDQIEIESKKNSEVNLKKIMKDFKEMKKENSEMMKQLKQG